MPTGSKEMLLLGCEKYVRYCKALRAGPTESPWNKNVFQHWMSSLPLDSWRIINIILKNRNNNVNTWRDPCLTCTHTLSHFAAAGHKAAGAHASRLGVKMGLHPGQVTDSLKGQRANPPSTIAFSPSANLELPVSLTCMPLDCGRKPEYLEGRHADTNRACRLHTGGSDSNPWPSCSVQSTSA